MRQPRRHTWLCTLPACAILLSISPAQAQAPNLRETQARRECLAGRYQAGMDLLAELFVETRDPNHIYNQARCLEQNGKFDDAILRFREYLRTAENLTIEEKAGVDRHIADCHALNAEQPGASPAAKTEPATASAHRDVIEVQKSEMFAATDGAGLRTAGIVTASVGAAVVITGVALGLQARSIADDVTRDNTRQTYDRNKDERGRLYADIQWVGYGVGGAALAVGAILYYLGYRAQHAHDTAASLGALPMLGPDQAGALLKGSF